MKRSANPRTFSTISMLLTAIIMVVFWLASSTAVGGIHPAPPRQLRIVAWNIEFLGSREPLRTGAQLKALAQRILSFDADVFALQEIFGSDGNYALERVRSHMGGSWETYTAGWEWAFLYDASKVELLSVEQLETLENPPYTPYPEERDPQLSGIFRPAGVPDAEPFRLIDIHWDPFDWNVRAAEGEWNRNRVIEMLADPQEPHDIILLGDFNCEHGELAERILREGGYLHHLPREDGGEGIDHFYATQTAEDKVPKGTVFVVRPEHYDETDTEFEATYSDHYPIFIDYFWVAASANRPRPADGVGGARPDVVLSWTAGTEAVSHDVYFGTDFDEVSEADNSWPVGTSVYKGNQSTRTYDPGGLETGANYYWRIDEVKPNQPDGPLKGRVWSFNTNDVVYVPSEYPTIQAVFDAAWIQEGLGVVVAEGTYPENINFNGKKVKVRSTDPGNPEVVAATIIEGRGYGPVVTFSGSETADCELTGFTITGGNAENGGGIFGGWATPTISRCVIKNNTAIVRGGGIYVAHGIIEGCTIFGNFAGDSGGAMTGCHGTIINCLIYNNIASTMGAMRNCDGDIINCTIVNNTVMVSPGGLGRCDGGIDNCIIWGNYYDQLLNCSEPAYSCIQDWTGGGIGNIDGDPEFVDANSVITLKGMDAYWMFDGGATDSSGNGHDGSLVGNAGFVHDPDRGQVLMLDGDGDYVKIMGYKGITGKEPRTISAWIKTETTGDIVSWGEEAAGKRWLFYVNTIGALRVSVYGGYIQTTSLDLRDGTWHHVAAVLPMGYTNVTDVELYVDDIKVTNTSSSSQTIDTGSVVKVKIGVFGSSPRYFNGLMDEVAIWDRALSGAEISMLYERGLCGIDYLRVEGDFHLLAGSPCIDAADDTVVPADIPDLDDDGDTAERVPLDLDGDGRFVDDPATIDTGVADLPDYPEVVDMGAYEGAKRHFVLSSESVVIGEGETAAFTVALPDDPGVVVEVTTAFHLGDSDITIESGAFLTFDSSNWSQPQSVTLAAAEDEDRFNGKARFKVSAGGFFGVRVSATEMDNEPYSNTFLVDANSPGEQNGSNWLDAFVSLQDALSVASAFTEFEVEIWVAAGTYCPTSDYGLGTGDRGKHFRMINGVAIYGGFDGTETSLAERDVQNNETILSGDIGTVSDNSDNCYHVFYHPSGISLDTTAILDGFTITAGNADGGGYYDNGGGMCNKNSSPIVSNCTFSGNSANNGGGMYNAYSSPTVANCVFSQNWATESGGAMENISSSPTLTNCTFSGNRAGDSSGGGCTDPETTTIFSDDFQDGQAYGWSFTDAAGGPLPSPWLVENDGGDLVLSGSGHQWATIGERPWTDYHFRTRVKLLSGVVHLNYRWNGCIRYFIGFTDWGLYLNKTSPCGNHPDLTSVNDPHNYGQWYTVEIVGDAGNIKVYVDNTLKIDYTDSDPLLVGSIAFETLDDSHVHFDDISVCAFSDNSAGGAGGGMLNDKSSPTVTNCTFSRNSASRGGGMFNLDQSNPTLTNCTFSGNSTPWDGAGMANWDNSSPTLNNCTFSNNSAEYYSGGGMFNLGQSNPTLTNCTFSNNSTGDGGGGMGNQENCNPTVTNCTFIGNSAGRGGGMNNGQSNPTVTNCTFSGNSAGNGGGMANYDNSSPTLTNCTFSGNSAHTGGGMDSVDYCNPTLTNCTFSSNSVDWWGGGMNNSDSSPTVTNCTLSGNSARWEGGGMSNFGTSSPTVTNCILWGNTASSGPQIYKDGTSSATVSYSDVQGGWPGEGNIEDDPMFVGPKIGEPPEGAIAHWKLNERRGSTAYDSAGENDGIVYGAQWTTGKADGALSFDGSDDWVSISNPGTISSESDFTWVAWIQTSSDTGAILARAGTGWAWERGGKVFFLWGGRLHFDVGWVGVVSSGVPVNDGQWHYVVVTVEFVNGSDTISFYVDGVSAGGGNLNVDRFSDSGLPLKIGFCNGNFPESCHFNGKIDDVRIYDKALSAEEIQQFYQSKYHLLPTSPCIDAGDNTAVPAGVTTDLDGNPRFVDQPEVPDTGNGTAPIVDMGAYEANYIEVAMKFTPRALNLDSQGKWLKAHLVLPEGFLPEDVNANIPAVIEPLGIESDHINVFINEDGLVEIEAAFSRGDFCASTDYGPGEITVVGVLASGQYFYGTDTIRIITNKLGYVANLAYYWLQADCGPPDWCGGLDVDRDSVVDWLDFAMSDGCCIEIIKE